MPSHGTATVSRRNPRLTYSRRNPRQRGSKRCHPMDADCYSRTRCLDLLSNLAIKDYNNRHKKDDFRVHQSLCFTSIYDSQINGMEIHLTFIAENVFTKKLKLFFAILHGKEVITCTVVEPGNPLFGAGCYVCHPAGVIYHPCLEYSDEYLGGRYHLGPYEEAAKELFDNAYYIKTSVQNFDTEDADKLKKTIDGYAHAALKAYHHDNEHVRYKHLESVFGVRFRYDLNSGPGSFWVHLIFKAKNDDPEVADDSEVYFFAELCLDSDWDPVTSVAIIPDPNSGSPRDEKSCKAFKQCLIDHPEYVLADCEKGYFADSLCNGQCKGIKSELLKKTDDASKNAWWRYNEVMRRQVTTYD